MNKAYKIISNNDSSAKTPDDERNWTAIDIFLFSNGQTQSPPRKYHLRAEELNCWEGLLSYLASSQFNSLNSTIELYTIDGRKVNGPLDLGDGLPYVAVLPPDKFIDSGYEKYLLKATRSWEKRQAKRFTEIRSNDVKADCSNACCPCPKKVDELQRIDELTALKASDEIVPIESALTRPQRSSTPKCEEEPQGQSSQINNSSALQKPSIMRNNRKRKSSEQHQSFASPQTGMNKIPSSNSNTKDINKKKILNKIPVKTNERNIVKTKGKIVQNKSKKNQLTPHAKAGLKQATTDIPKSILERPVTAPNSPAYTSNISRGVISGQSNNKLIKTPIIHDLITEKEITRDITATLHQNTYNQSALSDMNKTQILNNVTVDQMVSCHVENNGIDEIVQTDNEVLTNVISVPPQEVTRSKNELTNVISVSSNRVLQAVNEESSNDVLLNYEKAPLRHNEVSTDGVYISDSEIARTKKEIHVKSIHISPPHQEIAQKDKEVLDSETKVLSGVLSYTNNENSKIRLSDNYVAVVNKGDGINVNLNTEVQTGKTNTNLQDQESTVLEIRRLISLSDILKRSNLQNVNEESVAVERKSSKSIASPTNNFTRVVIVQCGCCGTQTAIPQVSTVPVFKDENGFFILMPGPTPAAKQSCGCGPNKENVQTPTSVDTKLSDSCLKPLSNSETIYPCVPKEIGVVMTVMHCGIRSANDCNDNESITLAQRVCIEETYDSRCNTNIISKEIGKIEMLEDCGDNCSNKSKTEDSCVQTEWCCILMQVKQHNDHHYSFHLPPLEMIKHYSR